MPSTQGLLPAHAASAPEARPSATTGPKVRRVVAGRTWCSVPGSAIDAVEQVGVEAGVVAGVAGGTHLVHDEEERVAVAVEADLLDPLHVAGRVALDPVLAARAATSTSPARCRWCGRAPRRRPRRASGPRPTRAAGRRRGRGPRPCAAGGRRSRGRGRRGACSLGVPAALFGGAQRGEERRGVRFTGPCLSLAGGPRLGTRCVTGPGAGRSRSSQRAMAWTSRVVETRNASLARARTSASGSSTSGRRTTRGPGSR